VIITLIKLFLVCISCFFIWLAGDELTSAAALSQKPELAAASGLRSIAKAAVAIWAMLAVMMLGA
jgi:hypothetical protein